MAGYPLQGVKVTLYDGSYHEVDSSEMAFKLAGSMATKDGALKASPILLEPMMDVEVVTPEDYMGDVVGDLNRRRGQVQNMEDIPSGKAITALVPLSEMFGYATDLRSATQGIPCVAERKSVAYPNISDSGTNAVIAFPEGISSIF